MNLQSLWRQDIAAQWGANVQLGTVTGTSGAKVLVRLADGAAADAQPYARLASYSSPQNDDLVLMAKVSGEWICLGEVVS